MACTVLGITNGALAVFSTFIFPSSSGTITLQSDTPNAVITIPAITELVTPVQGVDISGNLTLSPSIISGPNAGEPFAGSDASARTATLAIPGTHQVQLSVQGTLTSTAKGGSYTVSAQVTCE